MNKDRFDLLQIAIDDRIHYPDAAVKAAIKRDGSFYIIEKQPMPKGVRFSDEPLAITIPSILVTSRYLRNHEKALNAVAFFIEGVCVRAIILDQNREPTGETATDLEGRSLADFR